MSTIVAPDGREFVPTDRCGFPGCLLPAYLSCMIYGWERIEPSVLRLYEACTEHASLFPRDFFAPFNLDLLERRDFAYLDLAPLT